jgi:streptomycin 6-kinase
MVMSINLAAVIMAPGVDDLASYALTLPDQHSRPTTTMLATAVERLYLPQTGPPHRCAGLERSYAKRALDTGYCGQ